MTDATTPRGQESLWLTAEDVDAMIERIAALAAAESSLGETDLAPVRLWLQEAQQAAMARRHVNLPSGDIEDLLLAALVLDRDE